MVDGIHVGHAADNIAASVEAVNWVHNPGYGDVETLALEFVGQAAVVEATDYPTVLP